MRTSKIKREIIIQDFKKRRKKLWIINYQKQKLMKGQALNIIQRGEYYVPNIVAPKQEKSDLTEDMKNINMLYWVGTMNSIKAQAEEIVFSELIYI